MQSIGWDLAADWTCDSPKPNDVGQKEMEKVSKLTLCTHKCVFEGNLCPLTGD